MATLEINENRHLVQNDPHRCKIKLEKFHFNILCCCGGISGQLFNPFMENKRTSWQKNFILCHLNNVFEIN